MQPSGGKSIQVKRGVLFGLIVMPLLSGFAAFTNMLGNPRFQEIRSIDAVRLIAIGACWGAAAVGLAILLSSKLRKS